MPAIETAIPLLILVAILAYLFGAIPFGLVLAKYVFGLGDIREIGSGNIGATNVLRAGSKHAALLTLILDAGKGGIAVLIASSLIGEDAGQVAGFAAFFGHLYPIYLRFKGGKGVATFFGTLLALSPILFLISGASWLFIAAITRYSSLAGILAPFAALGGAYLFDFNDLTHVLVLMAALILWRHRDNIKRLIMGKESKIGAK